VLEELENQVPGSDSSANSFDSNDDDDDDDDDDNVPGSSGLGDGTSSVKVSPAEMSAALESTRAVQTVLFLLSLLLLWGALLIIIICCCCCCGCRR
jgi:hypothetical protein